MMSAPRQVIRIVCDEPSHPTRTATVDRFEFALSGVLVDGQVSTRLDDDDEPRDRVEVLGSINRPPSQEWSGRELPRERRELECPLCGLKVELKQETARKVAAGLAAAGASVVRLSALAAIVSEQNSGEQ